MWFPRLALPILIGLAFAATSQAYVPAPEELFEQWAAQVPDVSRLILELHTVVFDPAAARPPEAIAGGAEPDWPEIPEQAFNQRVYWSRAGVTAVETFSPEGELLHIYLDEGLGTVSQDQTPDRHFDPIDVLHPYLPFLGGTLAEWRAGLAQWGIVLNQIELVPTYKGRRWYRVGGAQSWALLSPGRLALAALHTQILGGPKPLSLNVQFSESAIIAGESTAHEHLVYVPHAAVIRIENRPLKVIKVFRILADPPLSQFPLERLRKLAALSPRIIDLESPTTR